MTNDLCPKCEFVCKNWSRLGFDNEEPNFKSDEPWNWPQHHESIDALNASAKDGCQLCAVILDCFRSPHPLIRPRLAENFRNKSDASKLRLRGWSTLDKLTKLSCKRLEVQYNHVHFTRILLSPVREQGMLHLNTLFVLSHRCEPPKLQLVNRISSFADA
jgi:hypothetical protein